MLKAHLDAVEQHLLQISRIPANAGHTLHRGTPREAFIREFLSSHLSARLSVGTGEIIDAASLPRQARHQFDIVIYKADFPRIDLGGGISAFLAEGVLATIEVKSLVDEQGLDTAVKNACKVKALQRNMVTAFMTGYVPPGILSYVIAYSGPASIYTVYEWLKSSENGRNLNQRDLPETIAQRTDILSESLEGVFVLGSGCILFDNSPISVITDENRTANPSAKYSVFSSNTGNLLWLFLLLTQASSNLTAQWSNLAPYLQRYVAEGRFYP